MIRNILINFQQKYECYDIPTSYVYLNINFKVKMKTNFNNPYLKIL